MTESDWQRKLIDALAYLDCWAIRINSGGVKARNGFYRGAPDGTPDILVMLRGGRLLWLELKEPGKVLRDSQVKWHARAAEMGIRVVKVESVREGLDAVKKEIAR